MHVLLFPSFNLQVKFFGSWFIDHLATIIISSKEFTCPLVFKMNTRVCCCLFGVFLLLKGKSTKVCNHFHIYPAHAQNCIYTQKVAALIWICSALKFILLTHKPLNTLMLGFFLGLWVQIWKQKKCMWTQRNSAAWNHCVVEFLEVSIDHMLEEPCRLKFDRVQFDRALSFISWQFICYSWFIIVAGGLQWAVLD